MSVAVNIRRRADVKANRDRRRDCAEGSLVERTGMPRILRRNLLFRQRDIEDLELVESAQVAATVLVVVAAFRSS